MSWQLWEHINFPSVKAKWPPIVIVFIAAQLQKSLCEMSHHVADLVCILHISVTKPQRQALTSRIPKLQDSQSPSIERQEPRWSHHFSWCAWAAVIGWKGVCSERRWEKVQNLKSIRVLWWDSSVFHENDGVEYGSGRVQEFRWIGLCHICPSISWQEFRGELGWEFGSPTRR